MILNWPSPALRSRRRKERLSKYHDWFAWRPVRLSGDYVAWLEWVERRVEYSSPGSYKDVFYRIREEKWREG